MFPYYGYWCSRRCWYTTFERNDGIWISDIHRDQIRQPCFLFWAFCSSCSSKINMYIRAVSSFFKTMWFRSVVYECGALLPIHTLNYSGPVVSSVSFLIGVVTQCSIAHRRSVVVLCLLCKVRCNPMHPHYDALPLLFVPVLVTRGALVSHRYTYALPRCWILPYHKTFIPLSVSLWNDLGDPVFEGMGLASFLKF